MVTTFSIKVEIVVPDNIDARDIVEFVENAFDTERKSRHPMDDMKKSKTSIIHVKQKR